MSPAALEKLVWLLIYGGLLALCLGIFVRPLHDAIGWALVAGGLAVTVAGVLGIWWRSRMK